MHNHHEQFTAGSNSKQEKGEQCAAQENEMFSEAFQEVEANVDYQQQLDLEKQNHMRFKTHEEQRRQTAEQGGHLKNSSGFTSNPRFKSAESVSNAASQPAAYRIGSDKLLDEEHTTRDDADELARTAGNLLESVKSDTSKKFQESNFLSLMRQLRDREVTVDGDKIVDVSHLWLASYIAYWVSNSGKLVENMQLSNFERERKKADTLSLDDTASSSRRNTLSS